ncbi:MAG TPA: hypothetical protein VH640_06345 [Bryobacteraceae bacterium]
MHRHRPRNRRTRQRFQGLLKPAGTFDHVRPSSSVLARIVYDLARVSNSPVETLAFSVRGCGTQGRPREQVAERQQHDLEEHALILEFDENRQRIAEAIFNDLADAKKARLRKEKTDQLRQQERFQRLTATAQHAEVDAAICQDIARAANFPPTKNGASANKPSRPYYRLLRPNRRAHSVGSQQSRDRPLDCRG